MFAGVKNRQDLEQYRQLLIPLVREDTDGDSYDKRQKVREDFYAALTEFGLCLKVALSSRTFFEDGSFTEALIAPTRRICASSRACEDRRAGCAGNHRLQRYEEQIRRLVDKHVVGSEVHGSEGVYLVGELARPKTREEWSEEKTRNETDLIRTRIKKTIEQELADDPYAQQVFSELLKQAIAEAEAHVRSSVEAIRLVQGFEDKVNERASRRHSGRLAAIRMPARTTACCRLVLGEADFVIANDAAEAL